MLGSIQFARQACALVLGRRFHALRMRASAAAICAMGALPLAVGVASSTSGCSDTTPGGPVAQVCPPGQKCQTRLTLLHTSDIHSRLFPYDQNILQIDSTLGLGTINTVANVGGVARLSYVLGRERARADRVLHLDSGDCFEGAPIFNFFSGEPEVRSLSLMGTDASTIGNHEFDRGALNVTNKFQKWASFPALVANYDYNDVGNSASPGLSSITNPFTVFNVEGLKVGVIGMGNLSSLTSVFDQPNRLGVTPLNTAQTAQFYVDLIRPYVDVVIMLTHLGLQVDEDMVRGTTGIDLVLGGHNHIVINPPQQLRDCSADPTTPGYVWAANPNEPLDPEHPIYDPSDAITKAHPNMFKRACKPRNVLICHSGAFAKYLGRLDLILSNDPVDITPTGDPKDYDPNNGFEIVSSNYTAFPINDQVPEDAQMVQMLEPYRRVLDRAADLDILVGYTPTGAKRSAPQGGDSALGNLIATAMWLRLGVQTDFSLTNTTGIRTDLNPGPITVEEMYNIFPFDNTITKMQLSGFEVQELFDFAARRSSSRSCVSQAQIAGARVVLNCAGCQRPEAQSSCNVDADCGIGSDGCNQATHLCDIPACAEQVYIGVATQNGKPISCQADADCPARTPAGLPLEGSCDTQRTHNCWSSIEPTNLYELATSNYLAGGGSGFRVLQRNTTQFDTLIQQRDALVDYLRQGKPCGFKRNADGTPFFTTPEGLKGCSTDSDCTTEGDFVCACAKHVTSNNTNGIFSCNTGDACDPAEGRCVRRDCRDQVATFHNGACTSSPALDACQTDLDACSLAGEECKLLSCVDETAGNFTDNRLEMLGR